MSTISKIHRISAPLSDLPSTLYTHMYTYTRTMSIESHVGRALTELSADRWEVSRLVAARLDDTKFAMHKTRHTSFTIERKIMKIKER